MLPGDACQTVVQHYRNILPWRELNEGLLCWLTHGAGEDTRGIFHLRDFSRELYHEVVWSLDTLEFLDDVWLRTLKGASSDLG